MNLAEPSFTIPYSAYQRFLKEREEAKDNLRHGQAFHQYMKLNRMWQDKIWCDVLYNAQFKEACLMIHSVMDWEN